VAQQAYSTTGTVSPSALPMELRVRRVRDGVEVVIEIVATHDLSGVGWSQ
jgi:hypothetical protein